MNIYFCKFEQPLRENFWKNLPFLWHIFKVYFKFCNFAKFHLLKTFGKKNSDLWTFTEINIHFSNIEQLLRENLSFLWNIFKFHFKLYTFTKFYYLKKFRKKWTFWNCQEINIHFCIFEQLLQEKLLKGLSFLWDIFQVRV